jgi:hypothetical protein
MMLLLLHNIQSTDNMSIKPPNPALFSLILGITWCTLWTYPYLLMVLMIFLHQIKSGLLLLMPYLGSIYPGITGGYTQSAIYLLQVILVHGHKLDFLLPYRLYYSLQLPFLLPRLILMYFLLKKAYLLSEVRFQDLEDLYLEPKVYHKGVSSHEEDHSVLSTKFDVQISKNLYVWIFYVFVDCLLLVFEALMESFRPLLLVLGFYYHTTMLYWSLSATISNFVAPVGQELFRCSVSQCSNSSITTPLGGMYVGSSSIGPLPGSPTVEVPYSCKELHCGATPSLSSDRIENTGFSESNIRPLYGLPLWLWLVSDRVYFACHTDSEAGEGILSFNSPLIHVDYKRGRKWFIAQFVSIFLWTFVFVLWTITWTLWTFLQATKTCFDMSKTFVSHLSQYQRRFYGRKIVSQNFRKTSQWASKTTFWPVWTIFTVFETIWESSKTISKCPRHIPRRFFRFFSEKSEKSQKSFLSL